nr:MAG TPA: hypothetical protein [Bacteriophage sp.]
MIIIIHLINRMIIIIQLLKCLIQIVIIDGILIYTNMTLRHI